MVRYSGEKKRRGIFRRLMARPFLVGGIAAGIAFILLAVSVFHPYRNAPISMLSDFKTGPKVFRTKIPEEIKIAQNLFRRKIPVVDQPVKPPTKIERIPSVEKKAVPSQPLVAPPEKSELQQETKLVQPAETQTKIETTPALAKAVPSQPTVAPPEKSEPQQETEPHPPVEPQTKVELILPAEEQSVYSQPNVAPSEQRELPERADLRQAEIQPQPVKEDVIEKTEERIIHSEKWLLSQESSYYTIQLMGARKEVLLFNFVEKNQLLEQNNKMRSLFIKPRLKTNPGSSCFMVFMLPKKMPGRPLIIYPRKSASHRPGSAGCLGYKRRFEVKRRSRA